MAAGAILSSWRSHRRAKAEGAEGCPSAHAMGEQCITPEMHCGNWPGTTTSEKLTRICILQSWYIDSVKLRVRQNAGSDSDLSGAAPLA